MLTLTWVCLVSFVGGNLVRIGIVTEESALPTISAGAPGIQLQQAPRPSRCDMVMTKATTRTNVLLRATDKATASATEATLGEFVRNSHSLSSSHVSFLSCVCNHIVCTNVAWRSTCCVARIRCSCTFPNSDRLMLARRGCTEQMRSDTRNGSKWKE